MSKTSKTPFQVRRDWIKKVIEDEGWPDIKDLEQQFPLTHQRALYRDLNSVYNELKQSNPKKLEKITIKVFNRVDKKVNDFADRDLISVFKSLVPQRIEQKTDLTGEIRVKASIEIQNILEEYKDVFEKPDSESEAN